MEIRLLMGESVGILTLPKAHFGLKARSVLSFSERVAISMLKVHFSRTMSSVKRCMQS
jgi:hypothetical protein